MGALAFQTHAESPRRAIDILADFRALPGRIQTGLTHYYPGAGEYLLGFAGESGIGESLHLPPEEVHAALDFAKASTEPRDREIVRAAEQALVQYRNHKSYVDSPEFKATIPRR